MLPSALLIQTVSVFRRNSQGRDSLNNPIYGTPIEGTGWDLIIKCLSVRLAFSSKPVQFASEGERVLPTGVMYFNPTDLTIKAEDRVVTSDNIQYIVVSVVPGLLFGGALSHFEAVLALP